STLTPILSTVSTLLSVAQAFYTSTTDPYKSLVTGLLSQAQAFNNDLFGTGVFNLSVTADNRQGRIRYDSFGMPLMTLQEAILAAVDSFSDTGDTFRPQFSLSANVVAVGFLATAPSPDQFKALLDSLLSILDLPDWSNFRLRIKRIQAAPTTAPV